LSSLGQLTHTRRTDGAPEPDTALRTVARAKIRHYRQLYINRPEPIAFMPVTVDTVGRIYEDFSRLLFLYAHREASALANEIPEESEQFRFLRAVNNHPPVAILHGAPVCDMDQFGAKAMELDLHIQGCIARFEYNIVAVIVEGDSRQPSFSVNGTWNTSSFSVTAIFTFPKVSKQYRFRVTVEATLPGIPAEEKILSVRDLIFRAPFTPKKSMIMEITAKANNENVFEAIRSRNFSDPVLPRGPALEMTRTCSVDPLSYLHSVFRQAHTTSQSSKSSCIITGFDESHEEEGMLMVLIAY
jgi:hypothetical protein